MIALRLCTILCRFFVENTYTKSEKYKIKFTRYLLLCDSLIRNMPQVGEYLNHSSADCRRAVSVTEVSEVIGDYVLRIIIYYSEVNQNRLYFNF